MHFSSSCREQCHSKTSSVSANAGHHCAKQITVGHVRRTRSCSRHYTCSASVSPQSVPLIRPAGHDSQAPAAAAAGSRHAPDKASGPRMLSEPELQRQMQRQVTQVRTLHLVPNYARPWETGHEVQSSCTAFILDPTHRLLVTTAGAVEAARKVVVCRVDDETEYVAQVVALCMDTDTALLTVGGVRLTTTQPYHSSSTGQDPSSTGSQATSMGRHGSRNRRRSSSQTEADLTQNQVEQYIPETQGQHGDHQLQNEEEEEDGDGEGEEGAEDGDGDEDEEDEETQTQTRRSRMRRTKGSPSAQLADEFWDGLQATEWGSLPPLQAPVRVAGFPIGGETLCITSGVLSRCEVLEYSHANRNLLALQVDAPLNNGVWGGPAYDGYGRVMGMAFQKFTSQTWMERYDEEGLDALQDVGGEEEGDEDGEGQGQGGGQADGDDAAEGPPGSPDDEEDAENVGYCVPALLLQHTVQAWEQAHAALTHTPSISSASESSDDGGGSKTASSGNAGSSSSVLSHDSDRGAGWNVYSGSTACFKSCVLLPGPPVLGIRWQGVQAPALKAHLGLQAHESGIRVSAVDASGSAAGILQPGDVLTSMGGQPIAGDGTILLRPRQRVLYGHAASSRVVGEMLPATVIREGKQMQLHMRLVAYPPLVPSALGPSRPLYLILGGAVLLQLTLPFMYTHDTPRSKGRRLKDWSWGHLGIAEALEWALKTQQGDEQVIILSELLSGSVAADGYSSELGQGVRRLVSVNGVRVLNMLHLAQLILQQQPTSAHSTSEHQQQNDGVTSTGSSGEASHGQPSDRQRSDDASKGYVGTLQLDLGHRCHPGFVTLGFADGSMMLLEAETLASDTQAALAHQGIQHAMSARLRAQLGTADRPCLWPRTDNNQAGAAGMQKRQQKRRLAFRR